ncbi:MAG: cell envelope integrity protein CreD [Ignavibacteriae bacterium]|nr:cell envelope integrity protein CreD [Ignavibacteriota bacterium]
MNDGWLKRSVVLRMIIVGALTFALLIPSLMVMGLISERESAKNSATYEVNEKWGQSQTIAGPILVIPYRAYIPQPKAETRVVIDRAFLLPESLSITTTASPDIRYRSIYEIVVYGAKLSMSGRFALNSLSTLHINPADMLWDEATLLIGISDLKGIRENVQVRWDGKTYQAEPGISGTDVVSSGISIKPAVAAGKSEYTFSADVSFNGSGDLLFVPAGKETIVRVASSWQSPSFVGRFLPDARTIGSDGFTADWKVLHLNRNFPQQWTTNNALREQQPGYEQQKSPDLMSFGFGVKLLQPVDEYQKAMRSAKYAIMFIALTFLTFFLTEVLNKKIVHPIQYALIGLGLILFYTLLLSLAEHIPFNSAYWVSGIAVVLLIAGYARAVLSSNRVGILIAAVLLLLYGFLFVILQQEDYALLFGSIGLFGILSVVMYLTRKIDWFAIGKSESAT